MDNKALLTRIISRRNCPDCGTVFSLGKYSHLKKNEYACPKCGSLDVFQREDDKEEVFSKRLEVFAQSNNEIVDYYISKKLLVNVDADKSVGDLTLLLTTYIRV